MKRFLAFSLCILALFLCACQPTPDHDVVVNKAEATIPVVKTPQPAAVTDPAAGTEAAEQPTEAGPAIDFPEGDPNASRADIPEHVKLEADPQETVHVVIDADVVLDRNGEFPVIEVKQKNTMSDPGFVKRLFANLCPSGVKAVYKAWPETKEEIAEHLAACIKYDGSLGEYVSVDPDDIDYLQDLYKNAPEEAEKTEVDIDGAFVPGAYFVEFTNGELGYLYFPDDDGSGAFMLNRYDGLCYKGMLTDAQNNPLPSPDIKLGISREEAVEAAEDFLTAMGISGYSIEDARDVYVSNTNTISLYDHRWELMFSRKIGSAAEYEKWDAEVSVAIEFPGASVGNPWRRAERLFIYVGDNGIGNVSWWTLTEPTRMITEDVPFLGFDECLQRAVDLFGFQYAAEQSRRTYEIKSIELVYGLISERDAPDRGLYVPLWQIIYNDRSVTDDDMRMFFSAIDGSIVEPRIQTNLGGY